MKKVSSSYKYTVLSLREAVERFSGDWESLIKEGRFNPTLSPRWLEAIFSSVGHGHDVQVLTSTRNAGLTSVTPFFKRKRRVLGLPVDAIELASNIVSYHAALVTREKPDRILHELVERAPKWQILWATNIEDGCSTARAIESVAKDNGYTVLPYPSTSSPYLTISTDWSQFLATKNKKFRYKLRKREQEISTNAMLEMRWFGSPSDTGRLLSDILVVESESWKADKGLAITDRRHELLYHQKLLPFLAESAALMANVLYFDNKPIAYCLCCEWDGWV